MTIEFSAHQTSTAPKQHLRTPCAIVLCLVAAAGFVSTLSGCHGDLRDIDAKTDQLMRDRAMTLGGGSISPNRAWPERVDEPADRRALVTKRPGSTNPASGELTFAIADEKRDVAARLAGLQTDDVATEMVGREMGLDSILQQAQQTAREYLTAEEDYLLAAIRLLVERHRFSPQLFGSVESTFSQVNTDGKRELTQRLLAELGARQQLPFGGEVAARWIWDATDNLRNVATDSYTQSSQLVLSGRVPLLRGFGDVAQESLIQAERNLVYAARTFEDFRRQLLVSLARDYFDLVQRQDGIVSQTRQLESLRVLESRQRAFYEAGRLAEFDVNLATNNVLQAQAQLANLRESYILTLDRFKVRLGLPVREPMRIVLSPLAVPEPDITLDQATDMALEYRLDLQNRRDRLTDSQRAVANAKNRLLPDLTASGNVALPTKASAREGGAVYEFDDARYSVTARLDLPLDRRVEKLELRASTIALAQAQRDYDQFRDNLILDVRAKTREIERARLNLRLAEERVKINLRRKEEQDLKPDEVTTQAQVDTANDLRDAERARDQARADLRNSVLDYLLATGQMRVQLDGTFEKLPGMTSISVEESGSLPTPPPAAVPPANP